MPAVGQNDHLWVVDVREQVLPELAGRDSLRYRSPPQPRADAEALIALLLGHDVHDAIATSSWRTPIAGGQRTITLRSAG
jgi:hypothetical protein